MYIYNSNQVSRHFIARVPLEQYSSNALTWRIKQESADFVTVNINYQNGIVICDEHYFFNYLNSQYNRDKYERLCNQK